MKEAIGVAFGGMRFWFRTSGRTEVRKGGSRCRECKCPKVTMGLLWWGALRKGFRCAATRLRTHKGPWAVPLLTVLAH
eukprot:1288697-Amphidinium_carterae.1